MFEELSIWSGSRVLYLPAICVTLWSLHGVLFRGWSVGELFFWSWCELMLAGVSGMFLIYRWRRIARQATSSAACRHAMVNVLALFFPALLATMFTLIAWDAEFGPIANAPVFVHDRRISIILCITGFALAHMVMVGSPRFPSLTENEVTRPLTAKLWPVLGLYLVMIEEYHLTGSKKFSMDHYHLLLMGGVLLGGKLCWELYCLLKQPN